MLTKSSSQSKDSQEEPVTHVVANISNSNDKTQLEILCLLKEMCLDMQVNKVKGCNNPCRNKNSQKIRDNGGMSRKNVSMYC